MARDVGNAGGGEGARDGDDGAAARGAAGRVERAQRGLGEVGELEGGGGGGGDGEEVLAAEGDAHGHREALVGVGGGGAHVEAGRHVAVKPVRGRLPRRPHVGTHRAHRRRRRVGSDGAQPVAADADDEAAADGPARWLDRLGGRVVPRELER